MFHKAVEAEMRHIHWHCPCKGRDDEVPPMFGANGSHAGTCSVKVLVVRDGGW